MEWQFIVALVIAIPIIAFPVFLWYLDIRRSYAAIREARKRRTTRREERPTAVAGHRETVGRGSK